MKLLQLGLVLLAGNPFYGPPNCAQPRRPGGDVAREHMDEIRGQDERPVLLVFGRNSCRPCVDWHRDFYTNTAAGQQLHEWYQVRFVDVTRAPEISRQHKVDSVPTFIAGEIRIKGYSGPDRIRDFLAAIEPRTTRDSAEPPAAVKEQPPAWREDPQAIRAEFDRLNKRIEDMQPNPADLAKQIVIRMPPVRGLTRAELDAALSPLSGHLQGMQSTLGTLHTAAPKEIIREVERSTLIGLLGLSPEIAAILGIGVGTGGAGAAVYFGFKVLSLVGGLMKRRRSPPSQTRTATSRSAEATWQTASPQPAETIVTHQIVPNAVQTASPQIVPVATRSHELDLLHEAMAHIASMGGQNASVVQAIQSAAKQLQTKAPHA